MKPPTITTFIACKNHGKFLQDAIDSIMDQTFKPTQFILLDDGSSDHSYQVMKRNADKDKRFTVIKHENSLGNIRSYNHCIELTKGDYVHLMSADDILADKYFYEEACLEMMKDSEIGFCAIGLQHIDEDGRLLHFQVMPPVAGKIGPKTALQLIKNNGNFICGGGVLVRSNIQKAMPYDKDFPYTADMLNWIKIFKYGKSGYFYQRPGFLYRQHPATLTRMKPATFSERTRLQEMLSQV